MSNPLDIAVRALERIGFHSPFGMRDAKIPSGGPHALLARAALAQIAAKPARDGGEVEAVARALFNDLRDRAEVKHAILRHAGLPYEAGFEDNKEWLMETALVAIRANDAHRAAPHLATGREETT